MAYELHIERQSKNGGSEPISLDEWKAAVSAIDGVRLCATGADSVTNPHTGEVISIERRDGDSEVYFPRERKWYSVLRWSGGSVHIRATFEPGDSSAPQWTAAAALARRLGAVIRGDDGEVYDLGTSGS